MHHSTTQDHTSNKASPMSGIAQPKLKQQSQQQQQQQHQQINNSSLEQRRNTSSNISKTPMSSAQVVSQAVVINPATPPAQQLYPQPLLSTQPLLPSASQAQSIDNSVKEPNEFFKQYRLDFNNSQQQHGNDSIHRIKFKKAEDDDHMISQHQFELSSFANLQFDKISPIQNSRNSNINNISESNRHALSELGVSGKPSSNNIIESEQLNEIAMVVGSNLNPQLRSNFANNDLELDYSSINPSSNNNNINPNTIPSNTNNPNKSNINNNHLASSTSNIHNDNIVKSPRPGTLHRDDILELNRRKKNSNGKKFTINTTNNNNNQRSEATTRMHAANEEDSFERNAANNDDYDDLFDYNEPPIVPNSRDKLSYLSLKDRLRNSFKKVFLLEKIESKSISHTIEILESQYRLINDLSSDVIVATKRKADEVLMQFVNAFCCNGRAFPSLNPSSVTCQLWETACLLVYAAGFFIVTVQSILNAAAFQADSLTSDSWIRVFAIAIFILDIFKGMLVGYFKEGRYEDCSITITHTYLKGRLIFDIISMIPLILRSEEFENYYARYLVSALYLVKLPTARLSFTRINVSTDKLNPIMRHFLSLLCYFAFLLHILTLAFHTIGLIEESTGTHRSWLDRYGFVISPATQGATRLNIYERYMFSATVSAGFMTNSTVFQTETLDEQAFSIIASFFALLLFAYFVNEVSFSLRLSSEQAQELAEQKKHINQCMDQTNVPRDLKARVSSYLEYLHEKKATQSSLQAAGQVIKKLPQDLRTHLLCTMKSFYVPYFAQVLSKFSSLSVANTFKIIEQQSYAPGDCIFEENSFSDASVYAIVSGEVEIYHTNSSASNFSNTTSKVVAGNGGDSHEIQKRETCVATLKARATFGEISFFTNMPHTASARCTEFSTIIKISRAKFLSLLFETNQEEDFEMLCMLRDEVLFKKNYKAINAACWSCNRYGHLAKSCKTIHFYPLKSRIINTRTSNYKQQRQDFFDRRKPSDRTYYLKLIEAQAKFSKDYSDEIFEYIERYCPGQSNRSDYQPSSQTLTSAIQQSSNTEILSDKIDYEQLQGAGSNLELPQPFNTTFRPILNNTLNESSMLRQPASSSKPRHKDSTDSTDLAKQRKDSAQTRNSNDSSFIKHISTNRSQNNNSNNNNNNNNNNSIVKRDSPIDLILKVDTLSAPIESMSNRRKGSYDETLSRDKTLRSQKTKGTQKTSKTNKSGSSIYKSKFEHAPIQRADSRSSIPASPHRSPLLSHVDNTNAKILLGSATTNKTSLKNTTQQGGGSNGLLLGNSFESFDSEHNQSYELVLPKIELLMSSSASKSAAAAAVATASAAAQQSASLPNLPQQSQSQTQSLPQLLIDNQPDNYSNMSSMLLDQQSFCSRTESNLAGGVTSPYITSYVRPQSQNMNTLEFDCMKNFKVYNTKSNLKNVLSTPIGRKNRGEAGTIASGIAKEPQESATSIGNLASNSPTKRTVKKKVTIIES